MEATGSDWIARGRLCMIEQGLVLARNSLNGIVAREQGLVLVWTGSHSAYLNHAMLVETPEDPLATLETARRFFTPLSGNWRLWAWPDLAGSIAPYAERAGFREAPVEPAMLLAPVPRERPKPNSDFSVRVVGSPGELRLFNETFGKVFLVDFDALHRIFNPRMLELPNVLMLLATQGGKPAGLLLGFISHGLLHILAVGILPDSRRMGLGTLLLRQAMYLSRDRCDGIFSLPAAGFAAYEDLGFRHLEDYSVWTQ